MVILRPRWNRATIAITPRCSSTTISSEESPSSPTTRTPIGESMNSTMSVLVTAEVPVLCTKIASRPAPSRKPTRVTMLLNKTSNQTRGTKSRRKSPSTPPASASTGFAVNQPAMKR